jgi:hypothetical protein
VTALTMLTGPRGSIYPSACFLGSSNTI